MTWVVEEPVYVVILGLLALAFLGFGWMQTGFKSLLYAMGGVVVLTAVLLIVERWIETDAEQVEATLHRIAAEVQRNNIDAALSYAHPKFIAGRTKVRARMAQYEFRRVAIKRNLEVTVDRDQQPPKAIATFNVTVEVTERASGTLFHVPRYVEVTLAKENGKWWVTDFHDDAPHRSMQIR